LNPSITFFLYEFFKRSFLPRAQRDDPGARVTFLMAAVSKAIASTITYPFSLAKARAQTSSARPVDSEAAEKLKDEAKHVRNEKGAEKTAKDVKAFAKRSTVFDTILKIYRTEGAAALYEGVYGEIMKGFFSHGLTMLVKESIHKLIIQTYYMILKALNKFPSPEELAKQASQQIQNGAERAGEALKDGYENVSETVGGAVQSGREAVGTAAARAGMIGNNATEAAKKANDYLERFGLNGCANKYPFQISGGQRQRVAIAQQFMCSEHFLLMDEPFSGLDPMAIEKVCELIGELASVHTLNTIIVITHDIVAAIAVSDTLWLMGRQYNGDGTLILGAKVCTTYDLIERGLAWRKDVTSTPEFMELNREIRERFRQL